MNSRNDLEEQGFRMCNVVLIELTLSFSHGGLMFSLEKDLILLRITK